MDSAPAPLNQCLLGQLQIANDIMHDLVKWDRAEGSQPQWLAALCQQLVNGMVAQLGLATARIWLYNAEEQCYISMARAGLYSPADRMLERLVADDSPLGRLVGQQQPQLSNTPAQEAWILCPEWVEAEGLQGFAAYPITLASQPLGALATFSHTPLQPEFLEVLKFIASFTAMIVANARQTEQIQQQIQREELLNRISTIVHQSLSWDEIGHTVVTWLRQTLALSRCCFLKVKMAGSPPTLHVTQEIWDPLLPPTLDLATEARPFDLAETGLFSEPFLRGEIVEITDVSQAPWLTTWAQGLILQLNIQAAVLIPVLAGQGGDPRSPHDPPPLLGLLGVFRDRATLWDTTEVELLQAIAAQLGMALTRAHLFSQIQQDAERQLLINSLTRVIRSSLDPQTLFTAITEQIGAAFQADVCVLSLWQPTHACLRPVGIYAPSLSPMELEILMPELTALIPVEPAQVLWHEGMVLAPLPLEQNAILCERWREGSRQLQEVQVPLILVPEEVLLIPLMEKRPQGDVVLGAIGLKRIHPQALPWQEDDLELAHAVAAQAAVALGQARLLTQTRQQAERASVLNRMLDRIRHSLNLDEILQAAVEEIGQALQVHRAHFIFFRPQDTLAVVRHAYAAPQISCWLGHTVPLHDNPVAPGLEQQTDSIVVNAWSDIQHFDSTTVARLQDGNICSLLLVRLKLAPSTYGVLSVHQCQPRHWTSEEESLMRAVGEQLVIAINQSRLYEKTQQQARRLALLNQIGAEIRTSLDPNQVLQSIVQSLAATLNLDRCEITLYSAAPGEGITGIPEVFVSGSTDTVSVQPGIDFMQRMQPWVGWGQSWEHETLKTVHEETLQHLQDGQPVIVADTTTVPPDGIPDTTPNPTLLQAFFAQVAIRSLALIPIRQAGSLLGTIALISYPQPRDFQEEELSLATAVAEQAGMALHQAQLYQQTRTLAQRESLLRAIAQQFTSTYERQPIKDLALAGMRQALPGADCYWWDDRPPLPSALLDLITQQCAMQQQSLYLSPAVPPFNPALLQACQEANIHSILCVPVMLDNSSSAGILCGFSPVAHRLFAAADAELVQALADMTAVSLQRTQFYEQMRQQEAAAAVARGLTEGREAESRRLAADLHDQTLADLGSLSRHLQQLAHYPQIDPRDLVPLHHHLLETIAELRGVVEDLQPTAMRAFTMAAALRSLLERAAQRSPFPLLTRFDDHSGQQLEHLDSITQTTLFRIVQEALNNIVKHAQAQRIDITIACLGDPGSEDPHPTPIHLDIKIIDDGIGLHAPPPQAGSHSHGLANMRYRATLIGAQVEWRQRRVGSGTVVHIMLPLPISAPEGRD